MIITSVDNARVKAARALHRSKGRREQGRCLVEGPHAVETAWQAGAVFRDIFVSPRFLQSDKGQVLAEQLQAAGLITITAKDPVLRRISDTETPQGIVAVADVPPAERDRFPAVSAVVVADRVSDPGNMGTIVRSAAAVGAGVWTSAGSTDATDPKALRASVGTLFLVPHVQRLSQEDILQFAAERGLRLVAADARGGVRYDEYDWREPYALVIGSEAHGVAPALADGADAVVRVPLAPGVESLNAAVTASICLFEAARQRRFVHR